MPNYRNIYNKIYAKNKDYNIDEKAFLNKAKHVIKYIKNRNHRHVLDIGCGHGHYLRLLARHNYDAFGIEISDLCCRQYLQDLPHKCIDPISYAALIPTPQYDAAICIDVAEHIAFDDLSDFIDAVRRLAPDCLFGIANHSDIISGIELHLIQQDADWWLNILVPHFKRIKLIGHLFNETFFFISASS